MEWGWRRQHRCRAHGRTRTIPAVAAWPAAVALGGGVVLTMLLASCQVLPESPVVASPHAPSHLLIVHVRERITGGNPMAPPPPTANPTERAAFVTPGARPARAGLVVRAVTPTAPQHIVAEQRTDAQGAVRLALPAGTYWVFAPWSDPPGYPHARAEGIVVQDHLPNSELVLCWGSVILPTANQADVTIIYTLNVP